MLDYNMVIGVFISGCCDQWAVQKHSEIPENNILHIHICIDEWNNLD